MREQEEEWKQLLWLKYNMKFKKIKEENNYQSWFTIYLHREIPLRVYSR